MYVSTYQGSWGRKPGAYNPCWFDNNLPSPEKAARISRCFGGQTTGTHPAGQNRAQLPPLADANKRTCTWCLCPWKRPLSSSSVIMPSNGRATDMCRLHRFRLFHRAAFSLSFALTFWTLFLSSRHRDTREDKSGLIFRARGGQYNRAYVAHKTTTTRFLAFSLLPFA